MTRSEERKDEAHPLRILGPIRCRRPKRDETFDVLFDLVANFTEAVHETCRVGNARLETVEFLEGVTERGILEVLDDRRIQRRPDRRAEIVSHVHELTRELERHHRA